ncbi:MAG: hypothetical protein HY831_00850, partial [Candidatus Aenigmarchaeota archaeon]|nr:hypothetical protein [Candidatus Aenigmarchaeota archaeon]
QEDHLQHVQTLLSEYNSHDNLYNVHASNQLESQVNQDFAIELNSYERSTERIRITSYNLTGFA